MEGDADSLVGRSSELALAASLLGDLGGGRARALVVEGEAGIGKTCVVQGVVAEARRRGVLVWSGHGHPFERSRPFGVMSSALGLRRNAQDPRRAAIAALLAGRQWDRDEPSAGDLQYRLVEELIELVDSTCTDRPVLLVAEDVHWADTSSLLALSALVRNLPLAPLLTVVTQRPAPLSSAVLRLLDDLAAAGAHRVDLRPLDIGEIDDLATQELGAPPGPALMALLRKSSGNPLWAKAILRTLAHEGVLERRDGRVETSSSEIPASLSELVVRRLQDLSPATLELLRVTATLGESVSVDDVAAVSRRTPPDVIRGLDEAFDAQLLDRSDARLTFRHQLVHDAIYQHTPAAARRLLHREAAVVLTAAGAARLDVADHLVRGAGPGDLEAIGWLREAAREASAHAPLVAVDLLTRAEALLPPAGLEVDPVADQVAAEIVHATLRAGRVTAASERAEVLLGRPHTDDVDTPVRLALVAALALQNRASEVVEVVRVSLAGATPLSAFEEVPMLAQQSWAMTYSGNHVAGEHAARRALAVAENADADALTVWALTALLVALGRQGRFDEALDAGRRAAAIASEAPGAEALPLQPRLFLGLALFDCDRVEEARVAFREALDDEFGTGWWLSETLMADAQASFVVGDWDDAVPSLVAGARAAEEKHNPLLLSQSRAFRVVIATGAGDLVSARELACELSPWSADHRLTYNGGLVAAALSGLAAAEGDRSRAYDILREAWGRSVAHGDRYYHRVLAPDLVRLALEHGDRDVAEEVTLVVTEDVALSPGVPSVRGLALRCRGLLTGDLDALLEAVGLARSVPFLVPHTGSCEDAAGLLAFAGRLDEAVDLLNEALERYDRAGADAWAARARARMRSLGAHPAPRGPRHRPTAGWESLTKTERAVAVLVAEGLTNGVVARQLYMSPHTVNTHLRHIFSKLGLANRVALAGAVHRATK